MSKHINTLRYVSSFLIKKTIKTQKKTLNNMQGKCCEKPQLHEDLEFDPDISRQGIYSISTEVVDWRIPRPVLCTNSNKAESSTYLSNYERNIQTIYGIENATPEKLDDVQYNSPKDRAWFSSGSSSSSSSHTASSGSLLISPNNLNSLKHDNITVKPSDTLSIASSTHFTLINGVTLSKKKLSSTCCTKGRQLTVLVITMTIILFLGILAAILLVEMRAMELRHS